MGFLWWLGELRLSIETLSAWGCFVLGRVEANNTLKGPGLFDSGASLRALAPQRVLTSSAFVEQVSPFQSHPPAQPTRLPNRLALSLTLSRSSLALDSRTEARALRATADSGAVTVDARGRPLRRARGEDAGQDHCGAGLCGSSEAHLLRGAVRRRGGRRCQDFLQHGSSVTHLLRGAVRGSRGCGVRGCGVSKVAYADRTLRENSDTQRRKRRIGVAVELHQ